MIGAILSGVKSLFAGPTPRTGDQLSVGPIGGEISGAVNEIIGAFDPKRITYDRMLQMRNDADASFGTALVKAPLINMNWRIQSKEDRIAAFVTAALKTHMRSVLKALSNAEPLGYKLLESVWKAGPMSYTIEGKDGTSSVKKLPVAWTFERFKPIDGRTVTLLADEKSGKFLGVRQSGFGPTEATVGAEQLVLWSFRDEDVDGKLTGYPLYHQVYDPWWRKQEILIYRSEYLKQDAKPIPIGRASIDSLKDERGTTRDGYAHMRRIGASRQQGAFVILPNSRDEKGNWKWDLEYRENSGRAGDVYQKAIDKEGIQILRAHGITDEVGTSQETGSRSRSETHADTFDKVLQGYVDEAVDEVINPQIVDRLVLYNFGQQALEESETKLVPAGLSPGALDTYRDVLKGIMDGEAMLQQGSTIPLRKRIDAVGICKALNVPLLPEDEVEPDPKPDPEDLPGPGNITPADEERAMKELKRRGAQD